ncbi:DUF853 domain-containing protein, partial [Pseudomonas sp. PS1]
VSFRSAATDEAHLLFNDTPKALQDRLVQVVRLIRSKGVGVYFVTQSPSDLPDEILAQLGLRIQHGLRAYTVREQKALRAVADGFRSNPAFTSLDVLVDLGIGEALLGGLEDNGTPAMVQRVAIAPPQSRVGPLSDQERQAVVTASPLRAQYDKAVDRESAYEILMARASQASNEETRVRNVQSSATGDALGDLAGRVLKSAVQQAANQLGRQLVRGLMGSLLGKKR